MATAAASLQHTDPASPALPPQPMDASSAPSLEASAASLVVERPLPMDSSQPSAALPPILLTDREIDVAEIDVAPFCWIPSTISVLFFTFQKAKVSYRELTQRWATAQNSPDANYQPFVDYLFDSIGSFFMHLYFICWFPAALHYLDKTCSRFHPYISNSLRFVRKIPSAVLQIFHTLFNTFALAGSTIGLIKESIFLKNSFTFRRIIKGILPTKNMTPEEISQKVGALYNKLYPNFNRRQPDQQQYFFAKHLRSFTVNTILQELFEKNLIEDLKNPGAPNYNEAIQRAEKLLRIIDIQSKKIILTHCIGIFALGFILGGSLLYLLGSNAVVPTAFIFTCIGLGLEIFKGLYITTAIDTKGWEISLAKLVPDTLKKPLTWKIIAAVTVIATCAFTLYAYFPLLIKNFSLLKHFN